MQKSNVVRRKKERKKEEGRERKLLGGQSSICLVGAHAQSEYVRKVLEV